MFLPKAIEDFYNKILTSILEPFSAWILRLSWIKRFIGLIILTLIGCGIYWRSEVSEFAVNFKRYYIIVTNSSSKIPLSSEKHDKLNNLIKKINNTLLSIDYEQRMPFNERYNSWTVSQIIVSTNSDRINSLKLSYSDFIVQSPDSVQNCDCWAEFKESTYGHHLVTSWVMLAHSKLDLKLKENLIDYILNSQAKDGWWGLFPCKNDKDASTFATANLTFALSKSLNNSNLSKDKTERIKRSIMNGIKWLEGQNDDVAKTLWFDYPNSGDKKEIIGINAFVLHVLNELDTNKDAIKIFYANWLSNFDNYKTKCIKNISLSSIIYDIKYSEQSGHTIDVYNAPSTHDYANVYNLPWFIIANVDSYSHASLEQKSKILKFLEEIIEQGENLYRETTLTPDSQPWLASEFLISLRRINNEKVF